MTNWKIGKYIAGELDAIGEEKYGSKIVSTVSRLLTWSHFIELAGTLTSPILYPYSLSKPGASLEYG